MAVDLEAPGSHVSEVFGRVGRSRANKQWTPMRLLCCG